MTSSEALSLLLEMLAKNTDSDWSPWPVNEVVLILNLLKPKLFWSKSDRHDLAVLLAPTGALQEIAMANGWHDTYMQCASALNPHCPHGT